MLEQGSHIVRLTGEKYFVDEIVRQAVCLQGYSGLNREPM